MAVRDVVARNQSDGLTAAEFTRQNLDQLGIGKKLLRVKRGRREYLLPQSSLLGAPQAAQPKVIGQIQNTKAAKQERAAKVQAKREALAAKRAVAEVRMGQPRKTRSDKDAKRGSHKK